ncbi:MAG TPA: hypothetical protein VN285_02585 [Candidatus Deferrimicrobium sp.]|nr:hypothetical protein [Candidatus Deferrimicrobium sp.]
MPKQHDQRPLTFKLAKWYGFILAIVFLLYGVVKVILGILDRSYHDMGQPIVFGLIGLVLIIIAYAYRDLKTWGWYGLIGINCLVVLLAVLRLSHYENILLLALSGLALYCLFSPMTRQHLFKR